jgi:hypothetical protein
MYPSNGFGWMPNPAAEHFEVRLSFSLGRSAFAETGEGREWSQI